MKKKFIVFFAFLAALLVTVGCLMQYKRTHQSIKSFTAVMCTAQDFSVSGEGAYLEIRFDDKKHTVKKIAVKDENIIKKISESNINAIIGVNIISDIPKNILKEKHIDADRINALQLLVDYSEFDAFFEIADVSFADLHSFVGKVVEETTAYMVVEPVKDKADGDMGDRVKVEYDTEHIDYLYGEGRKVVIYFKGNHIETDDGMKLVKADDISTEGFREFELEVYPSTEKKSRLVLSGDDIQGFTSFGHLSDTNLYYYGLDKVMITIKGFTTTLEVALEKGRITLDGIVAACNQDVLDGVIEELVYKDGGTQAYKYPEYTIIKYHTLDGNRDVYIGSDDIDIRIASK